MCPYSYQHFAMSNITKVEPQKDDYNTPIRYYATDELHSNIRQSSRWKLFLLQSFWKVQVIQSSSVLNRTYYPTPPKTTVNMQLLKVSQTFTNNQQQSINLNNRRDIFVSVAITPLTNERCMDIIYNIKRIFILTRATKFHIFPQNSWLPLWNMDMAFEIHEEYDVVRAVIRVRPLKVHTGEWLQQVPLGAADIA